MAAAKHFDSETRRPLQFPATVFQVASHKSAFKHAATLAANQTFGHIPLQTYIWLNFASLTTTVTKKTRKINLPSGGNWQVRVALLESLAFARSCIPPTHRNLFIIACFCHRQKKKINIKSKLNEKKNPIMASISRANSEILPQLWLFLLARERQHFRNLPELIERYNF